MTREEVLKKVQNIFRDIFDEDDMIIEDKTSADDIEEWDSLNHIILVGSIEKEFRVKFSLGELVSLKNIGTMIDLTLEKIK